MVQILVPIDFSTSAMHALEYALKLGEKMPSNICLIHCLSDLVEETNAILSNKQVEVELQKIKTDLTQKHPSQKVTVRIEQGYPEDILVGISKRDEPDVIVMGTKSKEETIKELLGSVTSDVIKKARVPVLAVPHKSSVNLDRLNRILFVTDFGESDYRSLHKLVRLVSPFETQIHAVHFTTSMPDKWDKKRIEQMQAYCEKTYRNHTMDFEFITGSDFLHALDVYMANKSIDMIAMTRHKRNMISKIFHSSITRKLLFHTEVPLLVFHE
ncbi:universal stress protein [Carboxylicivirga sp. N1Y90]|uniref:universal stress protein n=1 Tax=Carboxylicivirga fragile TaxID=3417571 RepID=UPI003D34EF8F|nr:universal stress protein [Marinilabiliaceae bacterium N1Y90]